MTSSRSKILVVDDDDRLRDILGARLTALGHEVIDARDGEDAIASALRENPDLILMDVMMPRMNGYEAARSLKKGPQTAHIPIVMVTALGEVNDRVRALDAGADDFLTKPVDASELNARVKSLLQVKAFHDHLRNYQQELESEVARKTDALRDALARLKAVSLDTIYRLARAAEFKDQTTCAHLYRVSHYAIVIARAAGQSVDWSEVLLHASPMHDIGKIGVSDHILCKPGKLTADEWTAMQKHTEIGASILAGSESELLKMAEVIARSHHEKWDGTGYPDRRRGEEIPLAARIVSIADVFDAVCSRRPYKEAMTVEQALNVIREGQGCQFDPRGVEAFFSGLDEILAIRARFSDERGESCFSPSAENRP